MNKIITKPQPLLKVLFLLLFLNLSLFANETLTEVSLSSLNTIGMLFTIILISLLGAFFIKDEV